ncbi:MAG: carbonate dehydratase [Thiomicrospira sp.]
MCTKCSCNDHSLDPLFENNQRWIEHITAEDPDFFKKLAKQQKPEYFWIGCSDSRVPANEIMGLMPGEVFVHRNVANMVNSSDMNCLTVVQYAVEVLKVKHIIVTGHYGCGGVKAAIEGGNPDMIEHWLRPIRKFYQRAAAEMATLEPQKQVDRLCEINVIEQVRNVCHIPAVRKAWEQGQPLEIHGLIFGIEDGRLRKLCSTIDNLAAAEAFVMRES